MGDVIDIFPWALERQRELDDEPLRPAEVLARLLADITEAHDLMIKIIPVHAKTFKEEDEWEQKVHMRMFHAKKHAQRLVLLLVASGAVDSEDVLEAWRRLGPKKS